MSAQNQAALLQNLQKLNVELWEKAHKLEFMLIQQIDKRKRNQKRFAKKLVRLAKYLEAKGISGQELASILQNQEKNEEKQIVSHHSSDEDVSDSSLEVSVTKKIRKQKRRKTPDETESDSDFEHIKRQPRGERQYLEEFLTLGELGGKIPPSLLVNVSFEKFAKENGFEPLEFEGTINANQYKNNGDQHKTQNK